MKIRRHSSGVEYSHRDESVVRKFRRVFIAKGYGVSLLSYDGARERYAFDVVESPEEWWNV
jgi:hypothetical protein